MTALVQNLNRLRSEINEKGVKLVAVSKYHPVDMLREAYDAGQRIFGESHVQELEEKQKVLPSDIEWHFIGHLQTNKVKYIAPYISLIHAVDTLKQQTGGTHTMTNKERKQENFKWYLNDVVMLYRKNGNLNGMSAIQKRYHVSSITKTQFFECGLDEAAKSNAFLGDDFCNKVYEYVLNRAKGIPAPKYKAE